MNHLPAQICEKIISRNCTNIEYENYSIRAMKLRQMFHLIVESNQIYEADVIVLNVGANDVIAQMYYDPRPGYPFNFWVLESLQSAYIDATKAGLENINMNGLNLDIAERRNLLFNSIFGNIQNYVPIVVAGFITTIRKLLMVAGNGKAKFLIVFTPFVFNKKILSESERKYLSAQTTQVASLVRERATSEVEMLIASAKKSNFQFLDGGEPFRNVEFECFDDHVHLNSYGQEIYSNLIATKVFDILTQ